MISPLIHADGEIVSTIRETTKQLQESGIGNGEVPALYDSTDPKVFNLAYVVGMREYLMNKFQQILLDGITQKN